jgi:DNA-binding transcriptional ArsR family regulator
MTTTLEKEVLLLHSEICAGLADANRILILYALAESPLTVSALVNQLGISQPLTSRHLKILRDRGMVTSERIGSCIQYSLGDTRLIEALDLLRAVLRKTLSQRSELLKKTV